jgi:hypothetical protein
VPADHHFIAIVINLFHHHRRRIISFDSTIHPSIVLSFPCHSLNIIISQSNRFVVLV